MSTHRKLAQGSFLRLSRYCGTVIDEISVRIKNDSLAAVGRVQPISIGSDILCKFCNVHLVLLASESMDAAQILEAVILTKSYISQVPSENVNDIAKLREQERVDRGTVCDAQRLTIRQRQIMFLLVTGKTNKNIALALGVSERTIESHRAVIMKKTGSKSFSALISLALATAETFSWRHAATLKISCLTTRQRQIMELVLSGQLSKNIAADLNISQRTVENHRATIMKRTGAKSLSALACLGLIVA